MNILEKLIIVSIVAIWGTVGFIWLVGWLGVITCIIFKKIKEFYVREIK
jgi:hypothetical protein